VDNSVGKALFVPTFQFFFMNEFESPQDLIDWTDYRVIE